MCDISLNIKAAFTSLPLSFFFHSCSFYDWINILFRSSSTYPLWIVTYVACSSSMNFILVKYFISFIVINYSIVLKILWVCLCVYFFSHSCDLNKSRLFVMSFKISMFIRFVKKDWMKYSWFYLNWNFSFLLLIFL